MNQYLNLSQLTLKADSGERLTSFPRSRMAVHAGRLPFTDLDAACYFAFEAAMALHSEHTYYCRYVFGAGPAARAALVCCTRVACYDSLGRLMQVCHPRGPAPCEGQAFHL